MPFGPTTGVAEEAKLGVPFGPMTVIEVSEDVGARVGVPSGPITVGAEDVAGNPLGATGEDPDAARARLRSVLESTVGMPSGPRPVRFGLMTVAPPTPFA